MLLCQGRTCSHHDKRHSFDVFASNQRFLFLLPVTDWLYSPRSLTSAALLSSDRTPDNLPALAKVNTPHNLSCCFLSSATSYRALRSSCWFHFSAAWTEDVIFVCTYYPLCLFSLNKMDGLIVTGDSYGPSPVSGGAPSPPIMIEGPRRPPSAPVGRRIDPYGESQWIPSPPFNPHRSDVIPSLPTLCP